LIRRKFRLGIFHQAELFATPEEKNGTVFSRYTEKGELDSEKSNGIRIRA